MDVYRVFVLQKRAIREIFGLEPYASLIKNRMVGTAIQFCDIDSGPYRNGRRYPALLNDYRQRSAAQPS
ncbi:hypothetical protein EVAR_34381_1 [Eumeta japonica]|uniref:Uncharacterized protein n=1 Tax=Eumeta variegata TaxID=151549 RepID=A0A4C1YNV9_EUMVA|nr:hypothetical protein EVAR_34381_1 [Eumeta japonica]